MEFLIKTAQLLLSLSILVVLHELGHFIPAKLFGTRVSKFYLFFDFLFPLPNFLKFSIFKIKRGETEYGIGWFPFGGYVQIEGMIDENMDVEKLKLPPEPWEFRSKKAWQRLVIMLGGVTVNAILGILIYWGILFCWGEKTLPNQNVIYGVAPDSLGMELGIKAGDKMVSADGVKFTNFIRVPYDIIINEVDVVQVERNGELVDLKVPDGYLAKLVKSKGLFATPRIPFVIGGYMDTSAAKKAGILIGDKIVAINDCTVTFLDEVTKMVRANKNKTINVKVERNQEQINIPVLVNAQGRIGISAQDLDKSLLFETKSYTLLEAFPAGIRKAKSTFTSYIDQMKLMFSSKVEGYKSIGGFGTLGSAFSPTWDWQVFWGFTAFLSIVLAIMNLLPIPALDGGHVLFLLIEVITGKKLPDKFLEYAQMVGMAFLLGLMLYANGNDVVRFFFK